MNGRPDPIATFLQDRLSPACAHLRQRTGDPLASHSGWQPPRSGPLLFHWPQSKDQLERVLAQHIAQPELAALATAFVDLAIRSDDGTKDPSTVDPFVYVMF